MFGPKPNKPKCDRPLLNAHVRDLFWQCENTTESLQSLVNDFPFCPKPFGDLNQISDNINEIKCVVIFCEACDDEEQEDIRQTLQSASAAYDDCKLLRFYWACEPTALTSALRETLGLGSAGGPPEMILLDFPCEASYYVAPPVSSDVTVQAILDFCRAPGLVKKLC